MKLSKVIATVLGVEQLPAGFSAYQLSYLEDAFGTDASYELTLSSGRIQIDVVPHYKAVYDIFQVAAVLHKARVKVARLLPNSLVSLTWES